jgi:hypothetical protein
MRFAGDRPQVKILSRRSVFDKGAKEWLLKNWAAGERHGTKPVRIISGTSAICSALPSATILPPLSPPFDEE